MRKELRAWVTGMHLKLWVALCDLIVGEFQAERLQILCGRAPHLEDKETKRQQLRQFVDVLHVRDHLVRLCRGVCSVQDLAYANASFLLSFPHICPKPVLVNDIHL
jgi:hypothetical protein